jgi:hypothetical protein
MNGYPGPSKVWHRHNETSLSARNLRLLVGRAVRKGIRSHQIAYFDRKSGGLQPIFGQRRGAIIFPVSRVRSPTAVTSRNRKERTGAAAGDKRGQASPLRELYPRIPRHRPHTTPKSKKLRKKRILLPQSQAFSPHRLLLPECLDCWYRGGITAQGSGQSRRFRKKTPPFQRTAGFFKSSGDHRLSRQQALP